MIASDCLRIEQGSDYHNGHHHVVGHRIRHDRQLTVFLPPNLRTSHPLTQLSGG